MRSFIKNCSRDRSIFLLIQRVWFNGALISRPHSAVFLLSTQSSLHAHSKVYQLLLYFYRNTEFFPVLRYFCLGHVAALEWVDNIPFEKTCFSGRCCWLREALRRSTIFHCQWVYFGSFLTFYQNHKIQDDSFSETMM